MENIRINVMGFIGHIQSDFIRNITDNDESKLSHGERAYRKKLSPEELYIYRGTFGKIVTDDMVIEFYHIPVDGSVHFWETYAFFASAYIYIVPCTSPEIFLKAKTIIGAMRQYTTVPIIVATPDNHGTKLLDCDLHKQLNLPSKCQICHYDINNRDSLQAVLLDLLRAIIDDLEQP